MKIPIHTFSLLFVGASFGMYHFMLPNLSRVHFVTLRLTNFLFHLFFPRFILVLGEEVSDGMDQDKSLIRQRFEERTKDFILRAQRRFGMAEKRKPIPKVRFDEIREENPFDGMKEENPIDEYVIRHPSGMNAGRYAYSSQSEPFLPRLLRDTRR